MEAISIYENLHLKDLNNEKWVDVIGYDGIYEVSNIGRVKSVGRSINNRWGSETWKNEKIIKQSGERDGNGDYISLNVWLMNKSKSVSRVVYDSFNPQDEFKYNDCVMHKNKIIKDNRLVNLKKVTRKKSKEVDMIRSKPTKIATPLNLARANNRNKLFYESRTHKECICCFENLKIEMFIQEHNLCKRCYNFRMRENRKKHVETRTKKTCKKCRTEKGIKEFPKHNKVYCKKCTNEYCKERKRTIKLKQTLR